MFRKCRLAYSMLIATATLSVSAETSVRALSERTPITWQSTLHPDGGEATRFVDLVLKNAKLDYTLRFMPWRRSYYLAKNEKNVLIYPLARTKERENHFHWVGQLAPVNYYLFKLKRRHDIKLERLSDAKSFRIGVVNYHAHHELLLDKGFENLQTVNNNEQNLKKLILDRIDLFPISGGGIQPLCQKARIDCSTLKPVLKLEEISGGVYMAYSIDTKKDIVEKTRASFNDAVASGEHQRLFSKRLKTFENFDQLWGFED